VKSLMMREVQVRLLTLCLGYFRRYSLVVFLKGGDRLPMVELSLDEFCAWLIAHESELVGHPLLCFHSPLASWLSEKFGHPFGVDGRGYGRALYPCQYWQLLPRWAELFASWLENVAAAPVTGWQALEVLAQVELAFWSKAA